MQNGDVEQASRRRGALLQQLLQLKRQQAALLFGAWDVEEEGRVLLAHVRPILLALFPCSLAPPCTQAKANEAETPKASARRATADASGERSGPRPHTPPRFAPAAARPEARHVQRDEEEGNDDAVAALTCSTTTCEAALSWPRVKHAYRRLSGRPWRPTQHLTLSELYAMMDYLCDYDTQAYKEHKAKEQQREQHRDAAGPEHMTPFYTGAVLLFDEKQLATDTPEPRPAVPRATAQHASLGAPPPPVMSSPAAPPSMSLAQGETLPCCAAALLRGTIERAFYTCCQAARAAGEEGDTHTGSREVLAIDARSVSRLGNHLLGRPFSAQESRALGHLCRESITSLQRSDDEERRSGATGEASWSHAPPRPHEATLACDTLSLDQFVHLVTQC